MLQEAKQWFREARFGAFIHWGVYALPGGRWKGETMDYIGEWLESRFRIPHAEYAQLAREFNPTAFDADAWIGGMARAGMRYLVFTAKHHDGFAMYRSQVSPFNIADATPWGRDPLAELAEACRKHGVKLGIYYSHCLDWSDPDGADPGPEFPTNFGMSWGNDWDWPDRAAKNFDRYFRRKALPQLTELMTNYGDIAVLWLDCPMVLNEAQAREIVALVRARQPRCLINSRIGFGLGDYGSLGDNQHPVSAAEFPLETPATLNDTWGFKWDDQHWKSASQVARELVTLADLGANYLLNIGPRPDGAFPEAAQRVLEQLADWMPEASDAIHGASPSPFPQPLPGMRCTTRENRIFLFGADSLTDVALGGIRNRIVDVKLPWRNVGGELRFNTLLPHVELVLDGVPDIDPRLMVRNGVLRLTAPLAQCCPGRAMAKADGVSRVGAAGEVFCDDAPCRVGEDGFWINWHHPGDALEWHVVFPRAGRYRVALRTVNGAHSAPWIGAREIAVRFGAAQVAGQLAADHVEDSPYYATAVSEPGVIEIAAPGEGVLRLETRAILDEQAKSMALAELTLTAWD